MKSKIIALVAGVGLAFTSFNSAAQSVQRQLITPANGVVSVPANTVSNLVDANLAPSSLYPIAGDKAGVINRPDVTKPIVFQSEMSSTATNAGGLVIGLLGTVDGVRYTTSPTYQTNTFVGLTTNRQNIVFTVGTNVLGNALKVKVYAIGTTAAAGTLTVSNLTATPLN